VIPIAQLDPASMTMWIDPELVSRGRPEVAEALHAATLGDVHGVAELVASIDDPRRQGRCGYLASAVWHEQRHFLDLLMTNYGAFRFRQFASIYVNIERLVRDGLRDGLTCPITAYSDPVLASQHGIDRAPEGLAAQAGDLTRRMGLHHDDSVRLPTERGWIEVGGEAQLEALAYFSQQHSVLSILGYDVARRVHEALPENQRDPLRYSWLLWFADQLDLLPAAQVEDQVAAWDVTLLYSVLLGSLAVRRWNQEQAQPEGWSSGHAASRLGGLMNACRRHGVAEGVRPAEAWQLVNDESARLWERSILEEMTADYEHEAAWLDRLADHAMPDVHEALVEFHALRGNLLGILRDKPEFFVDPDAFPYGVLPALRPMPVMVSPSGQKGDPPEGWIRLIGYRHSDAADEHWWWAAIPETWPTEKGVLALRARKPWLGIVEHWAPLAKLLTHGRRHRVMLGPELFSIEARFLDDGLKFRFDRRYAFPDEAGPPTSGAFYFDLTGESSARCDWCRTPVEPPAHVLSPWTLRKYRALGEQVIARHGGGQEGHLEMWRDWSIWVLCDNCAAEIRATVETSEPEYEASW
jgi:hypothetical protein